MWEKIKDKLGWLGFAVLGFLASFLFGKYSSTAEQGKQEKELKKLIREQEKEIDKLEKRKSNLTEEIDKLDEQYQKEQAKIEKLVEENQLSQKQIDKQVEKIENLKDKQAELVQTEKEAEKTLQTLRRQNNELLEGSDKNSKDKFNSISDLDDAIKPSDGDGK